MPNIKRHSDVQHWRTSRNTWQKNDLTWYEFESFKSFLLFYSCGPPWFSLAVSVPAEKLGRTSCTEGHGLGVAAFWWMFLIAVFVEWCKLLCFCIEALPCIQSRDKLLGLKGSYCCSVSEGCFPLQAYNGSREITSFFFCCHGNEFNKQIPSGQSSYNSVIV